jgi:hypothetical protein
MKQRILLLVALVTAIMAMATMPALAADDYPGELNHGQCVSFLAVFGTPGPGPGHGRYISEITRNAYPSGHPGRGQSLECNRELYRPPPGKGNL